MGKQAFWSGPGGAIVFGVFFIGVLFLFMNIPLEGGTDRGKKEQDPDRARFMMECTHDWGFSASTCREILEGKDPPPAPEFVGC